MNWSTCGSGWWVRCGSVTENCVILKNLWKKYDYEYQPHEIEAREQEEILYLEYLIDKEGVPDPKVAQFFPNRLLQAV